MFLSAGAGKMYPTTLVSILYHTTPVLIQFQAPHGRTQGGVDGFERPPPLPYARSPSPLEFFFISRTSNLHPCQWHIQGGGGGGVGVLRVLEHPPRSKL